MEKKKKDAFERSNMGHIQGFCSLFFFFKKKDKNTYIKGYNCDKRQKNLEGVYIVKSGGLSSSTLL